LDFKRNIEPGLQLDPKGLKRDGRAAHIRLLFA